MIHPTALLLTRLSLENVLGWDSPHQKSHFSLHLGFYTLYTSKRVFNWNSPIKNYVWRINGMPNKLWERRLANLSTGSENQMIKFLRCLIRFQFMLDAPRAWSTLTFTRIDSTDWTDSIPSNFRISPKRRNLLLTHLWRMSTQLLQSSD